MSRDLEERIKRAAETTSVYQPDGRAVWRQGRRRHATHMTGLVLGVALTLTLGAVIANVFRDGLGTSPVPPIGGTSNQSCPEDRSQPQPQLKPGTYSEDGRTVMPIAFVDGTTAEFLYPPELGFEQLVIQPVGHVSVNEKAVGAVGGTFTIRFLGGEPGVPASTEPDGEGGTRRIWNAEATSTDNQTLVIRLGCWGADFVANQPVSDSPAWEQEFEKNLVGVETANGFLVFRAKPPLHVWGIDEFPAPPGLYLGDYVSLQPGCPADTGEAPEYVDGDVRWCESGILVNVRDPQLAERMIGSVSLRGVHLSE